MQSNSVSKALRDDPKTLAVRYLLAKARLLDSICEIERLSARSSSSVSSSPFWSRSVSWRSSSIRSFASAFGTALASACRAEPSARVTATNGD